MKTVEESVVMALDGGDTGLFPYLPYILQDLWEFGTDPGAIIRLIRKHCKETAGIHVLDLGCGKGAVSVQLARQLGCSCHGIDAVAEFIDFASNKAAEFNTGHLCTFETGDIRVKVPGLRGFDVVVLGAIGPVFGDYYTTLTTLADCINKNGMIIIDDGYIPDDSDYCHPAVLKKTDILQQIRQAGMALVDEELFDRDDIKNSDEFIFGHLKKRCEELIEKYPAKQDLFLGYIKTQETENDVLENKITGSIIVIQKTSDI
jgi:SAM-dependent methyltransferase